MYFPVLKEHMSLWNIFRIKGDMQIIIIIQKHTTGRLVYRDWYIFSQFISLIRFYQKFLSQIKLGGHKKLIGKTGLFRLSLVGVGVGSGQVSWIF